MHRSLIASAAHAAILTASILGTAVAGLAAGFVETDLVANKSPLKDSNGVVHNVPIQDPNLLNPWGLTTSSSSPFWVADNGAGVSTLYNTAGTPQARVVSIPAPAIRSTARAGCRRRRRRRRPSPAGPWRCRSTSAACCGRRPCTAPPSAEGRTTYGLPCPERRLRLTATGRSSAAPPSAPWVKINAWEMLWPGSRTPLGRNTRI